MRLFLGINPKTGGTNGGTRVTISGANFSPQGLWNEVQIFFGDDLCELDRYHSGDNTLICYTPICRTSLCQAGGETFSGNSFFLRI